MPRNAQPLTRPLTLPLTAAVAAPDGIWRGPLSGIQLSNSSFTAGDPQGAAIGVLSVSGGTGTYTFTLVDSASDQVQVGGVNGAELQVGPTISAAGSFSIAVHADNGAGSVFDRTLLITANAPSFTPSLDFSDDRNSQFLGVI